MAKSKRVDQVRALYNMANNWTRKQWENVNQKGYEFAHDERVSFIKQTSIALPSIELPG